MKRRLILLCGIALLLWGSAEAAALAVIDDAGRSVMLDGPPTRIMTLTPGNTEILFALGAQDRIVAVDRWSDFPPAAHTKPRVVPFSPSLEQIVRFGPDLILSTYGAAEPLLPLERRGIRVMIFAPRTLDDIYRNILLMGRIVDAEPRAERLVRAMRERVAQSSQRCEMPQGPRSSSSLTAATLAALLQPVRALLLMCSFDLRAETTSPRVREPRGLNSALKS